MESTTFDDVAQKSICLWDDPLLKFLAKAANVIMVTSFLVYFLGILIPSWIFRDTGDAKFTVDLAGFEGMNATVGRTVSPAFDLTVHVENPRKSRAWCLNRGEVVVSYSDVSLAWGTVPGFCVQRATDKFTVVPWGKEVGLSESPWERLTSERHMGTAKIYVDMKFHYYSHVGLLTIDASPGTGSISQELKLEGQYDRQIYI